MYIEDWRNREAKEQVVCCTPREPGGGEVGPFGEVCSGEVDRVKPEDTAFMAGRWSAWNKCYQSSITTERSIRFSEVIQGRYPLTRHVVNMLV